MQNSDHHGDDVVLPTPDEDEMNVHIEQATDVEALQPGAYSVTPMTTAISSPRPQTTTEPTDVSGDDDKDANIDPANVIDDIIIEAEATPVAHIVPTDEPFAIGIQMRRRTTMTTTMDVDEDEASESFRNSFRAIVSNANAVLDINDHLNECHPNRLREDMDKNMRSYYWH
jgi:antitoxin (DNA-binding transcriptional repressor) of toxin-antitoxin stability system